MDLLDQSLSHLARHLPGATRVLHAYELDFCCGGRHSLREAAAARGLNAEAIAQQLAALPGGADDEISRWQEAAPAELIAHVLERYHAVHRTQLPELVRLARRVEQVHGERPDCPVGLADLLDGMQQALESHMQKEEQVLFPLLARGQSGYVRGPITVMRMEHDEHGATLEQLARLTDNLTPPRAACTTWRALYLGLRSFREDLMNHIHLENNVLFEEAAPVPAATATAG